MIMLLLWLFSILLTGTYIHGGVLFAFLADGHAFAALSTAVLSAAHPLAPLDQGTINNAIENVVTAMKTVGRPVAILGVMLLALSWVAAGILPGWARQNQGVLVKMLMGGVLLGIAGDVVSLVLPEIASK